MIHALFIVMPAFAILFWLVFFFSDKEKTKTVQYLLPLLSIILISVIVLWVFFDFNFNYHYYILDSIWVFTSLSVYPLYYYYIRLITVDEKVDYRWTWLLIPAFSLTVFSIVVYIMMSPQEIELFSNEILYQNRPRSGKISSLVKLQILRMKLFEIVFAAQLILTFFFGVRHIIIFDEKAIDFYSNIINRKSPNIKLPLVFLFISAITALISNIIGGNYSINTPYILVLPFIIHSASFIGLLYSVRNELSTVSNTTESKVMPTNNNNLDDKNVIMDELFNNLEHLLKNDHIYKEPTLRLNDIAILLGSNRTYISQLINLKANSNFSDYINSYRITYAKELLSSKVDDNEQLTLNEIATKSGFSSVSSFYRVFTKLEETSPAKYRAQHIEIAVEQD